MTIRQVLNRRVVVLDRCAAALGLCVIYLAILQWSSRSPYGPWVLGPGGLLCFIVMGFKGRCIDCPCCRKRLDHCLVRDEQKAFPLLRRNWGVWFLLGLCVLGQFSMPAILVAQYALFGLFWTLFFLELILVESQVSPATEICPHCGINLDAEWGKY